KSSKLCEGDIIVIENAGFKFVECWVKDKNGVPRGNGIYEVYKGENLHLRGQTQNDPKIGIWYLYDEDGNIIDECNYSNDKSCVLEQAE
ncbi:MAG TPA: hypothetical protein VLB84_16405, partial [Bacteroidia bacterium]|nr:hypothetical protein [Bacteroidia bacterium]